MKTQIKNQSWQLRSLLVGAAVAALVASPLARADYPSTVLSQSPVGYWRLGETIQPGAGALIAANAGSLGTNANGTYNNFPTKGLTGPFAGSSAIAVNGLTAQQTISTPYQAGINPVPFSVELWVKPTVEVAAGNAQYIASSVRIATTAPGRSGWYLAQDNGGTFGEGNAFVVRLFAQPGAGSTTPSITLAAPVGGTGWQHLLLTYDGANAALYHNGVLKESGAAAFVANPESIFTLGTRSDNAFGWDGQIAEAAIYNVALSSLQASNHYYVATNSPAGYAATVTGDSARLYYRFQEPVDPVAANSSAAGSALNAYYIYDAVADVSGPSSPPFAGLEAANKAVSFNAGGGVVRIPTLNLNTNTVTMACWVKVNGVQQLGSGLIVHGSGSSACGLTTDQIFQNRGLGYIWNGVNYGISPSADFGLPELPDNDWAFAALVIRPSQAEIYICDSVNYGNWAGLTNSFTVNHSVQQFGAATLIGTAAGYTAPSHSFKGSIDEVAIWKRALSAGELYTQYAEAVGAVPPKIHGDLVAPVPSPYENDPLVLTVDAGGSLPLTYIWKRDGNFLTTTTNGTFTIPSVSLLNSGTYDVTVTNLYGNVAATSLGVSIIAAAAPVITQTSGFNSRTLYPTGELNMAVSGTGGGLKYQWYTNGVPLGGATNSTLRIVNLRPVNAGSYSVSVTNQLGTASNGPTLVSIPATVGGSYEAAVITSNPQSWWRLDETGGTNLFDGMGRHDGYYTSLNGSVPPVTFGAAGALLSNPNPAVTFTPSKQGVGVVPYSPALNPNVYTVELWVKTTVIAGGQVPASTSFNGDAVGWRWSADGGNWIGNAADLPGNGYTTCPIISGYWSQLVITYDRNRGGTGNNPYQYFINGQGSVIANYIWTGPGLNGSGPLIIGGHGVDAGTLADRFFDGQVDEVAIYPRLLSAAEITNHWVARGIVVVPPSFSPMLSQTVAEGTPVTFSTTVLGTSPQLQWYKNNTKIVGATSAGYSIPSTTVSDNGTYTLWATNSAGTNSVSATLAVFPAVAYANVTNDLVLHLRFDGNAADTSGRGNNGTEIGSPSYSSGLIGAQALSYETMVSGTTVTNASYVRLGTAGSGPPTDLRFGAATSFTVGLWVRMTNSPGDLPFIGTATNAANNPGWVLCPSYQAGGWQWGLNDGAGNNLTVSGAANSINDSNWHHFALVVNRTSGRANAYLDGAAVSTRDISTLGSIDNNNYWPISVGQDPTGLYPEAAAIKVDDIGIWRKALTSLELASIASAGRVGGNSFDTVGPIPLSITPIGGNLVISYGAGTLLEAANVTGPYTPVVGAAAPQYSTSPSGAAKFYRVQIQ